MNGRTGHVQRLGDVIKKNRLKDAGNRRVCMKRLMNDDEAKEACLDEFILVAIAFFPKIWYKLSSIKVWGRQKIA